MEKSDCSSSFDGSTTASERDDNSQKLGVPIVENTSSRIIDEVQSDENSETMTAQRDEKLEGTSFTKMITKAFYEYIESVYPQKTESIR